MINVIITGSTGMVGEGVLLECLTHPSVDKILVINRRPCGVKHPKLTEIIHTDFFDLSPVESSLTGYNACFFCLGISSVGVGSDLYYHLTYDLTMHFAEKALKMNKEMTFCYVSGSGTDSSEKGMINWARVKGKTENDLMKMTFKQIFAFRPGFLNPTEGMKNAHKYYKYFKPFYPFFKFIMPGLISTLKELGLAMINSALHGYDKNIIEVKDILNLSKLH